MARLGRIYRAVLFAGVLLAVWAVAIPAFASPAPLCDDRGATLLATPPALEAPDVAIERARASATCDEDAPVGVAVLPGQNAPVTAPLTAEPMLPTDSL